jgi:hypothetical protein
MLLALCSKHGGVAGSSQVRQLHFDISLSQYISAKTVYRWQIYGSSGLAQLHIMQGLLRVVTLLGRCVVARKKMELNLG